MLKLRHRVLVPAVMAAVGIAAAAGAAAASAAPHSRPAVSGSEHVQVMSTSMTAPSASAIATGAFTAAGKAYLGSGKSARLVLAGGSIKLSHKVSRSRQHFYPGSCLNVISQRGTYKILSGTGKYAHISGHGTFQLSLEFVGARAHGMCTAAKPPIASEELLRLSGPVKL